MFELWQVWILGKGGCNETEQERLLVPATRWETAFFSKLARYRLIV